MSPTRKSRAGAAFMAGAAAAETPPAPARAAAPSGNWSRQAYRELEGRVQVAQEEADRANKLQYEGILEGSLPVRIPAEQITDVVGTDRILSPSPEEDPSDDADGFRALVENIRQRGLRIPIRVRPIDAAWRPDPAAPRDMSGQKFALQSGRRRLAACRELGIEPLCFISFYDDGDGLAEDLRERFFENSVRKNLGVIERFYSIGLIARETGGASQQQIGEILGINVAYVNRGLAVVEHFDALSEMLDMAKCTRTELDAALAKIREANKSQSEDARRLREKRAAARPPLPFKTREIPLGKVSLKNARSGGRSLTIESPDLTDEKIEIIMKALGRM